MSQTTQINELFVQPVDLQNKEKELTNEEYETDDMGKFEQHAHAPTLVRTQSALAEHLTEDLTGSKRQLVEPARTVEEQCTAIIGNTPWPFSVCWLCGFPVGEQEGKDDTMLQWIASAMGIKCHFINPLSARWDKQTCEHVNPINIAGTAFLNKGAEGYKYKHSLNIRMEYESAHDFCNILKNEGYLITLEKGDTIKLSFKGLTVATWQINAWPNFLLNGSMNGPSLSSVICFVKNGQMIFLKSPIHGYLFLKVLEIVPADQWDRLFTVLRPTDELATINIDTNGNIQIPSIPYSNSKDYYKSISTYFKDYVTRHEPKRTKTNPNPGPGVSSIHNILSIASIGNPTFKGVVDGMVNLWKGAIKKAMTARTKIFVDYINKVDALVGGLLWPLMKSSTQQTTANFNGRQVTYDDLDRILHEKLDELETSNPSEYERISVLVLTQKERADVLTKYRASEGLPLPTKIVRPTQRDKLPQPVAGLPVTMSLAAYTNPTIFRFLALEAQKKSELSVAYGAVAAALYDPEFMSNLKQAVQTGRMPPTVAATKLITTAEEQRTTTGNNNNNNTRLKKIVKQNAANKNMSANTRSNAPSFRAQYNRNQLATSTTNNLTSSDMSNGSRVPNATRTNQPRASEKRKRLEQTNGGTRKQRKQTRKQRIHKQKKNKKTRKNKKLTKRF